LVWNGQKKGTQDGEVKGAAVLWGQMKAAPVAYDVVSFLPTQTSSTRLMVLGKKSLHPVKDTGIGIGGLGWLK
jgi:hypothetical protein